MFSQQVQIKCFPFRGALTDDTVVSELSDKLLCMAVIVFCGNTAVMNLGAEAVGFILASVTFLRDGVCVAFLAFARRSGAGSV